MTEFFAMTLDELVNAADPFSVKSGFFTSLDQLETQDLVPFRCVHEFETCLQKTKNGLTYLNHFYFWRDLELCGQTAREGSVLLFRLEPRIDGVKKWPIPICLLRVDVSGYELSPATPESKMNYVVCLNDRLLKMAAAIDNADTAWVRWDNGTVSRNPRSPGSMLAAALAGTPVSGKKKWWSF